jgi:hypothetical protein
MLDIWLAILRNFAHFQKSFKLSPLWSGEAAQDVAIPSYSALNKSIFVLRDDEAGTPKGLTKKGEIRRIEHSVA